MTGSDTYFVCDSLYDMFTIESKNENYILPDNNIIKLIKLIKNESYKIMYKNLMGLLSNKSGKREYAFTNEILLYKFFDKYLLKNYNFNDCMKINKSSFINNLIPKKTIYHESVIKNKIIIREHFNIDNNMQFQTFSEMFQSLFNIYS
jgi:hypothetical protein